MRPPTIPAFSATVVDHIRPFFSTPPGPVPSKHSVNKVAENTDSMFVQCGQRLHQDNAIPLVDANSDRSRRHGDFGRTAPRPKLAKRTNFTSSPLVKTYE